MNRIIKNNAFFENKKNLSDFLPYIYGLLVILKIISRSTFSFTRFASKLSDFLIVLILIIVLILVKYSLREYLWLLIGLVISGINFYFTKQTDFFFIVITLFVFRKTSPREMLKVILITTTSMLTFLFLCSKLNYITNLSFFRGNLLRQSFGTQYPLVFSAYVLCVCVCLSILYGNGKRIELTFLFLLIILLLNRYTNSRNDELSILLLILIMWVNKLPLKVQKNMTNLIIGIYPLLILFSIFITNFISYSSNTYLILNKLFSGRLGLQQQTIELYKVNFFGNVIPQNGLGGQTQNIINYFYIDNSYMRFLYMGGAVFFIFILCTIICTLIKIKNICLVDITLILLVICFNGITSDSFYYLNTSLLMPLFFIEVSEYLLDFKKGRKMN